MKFFATIRGRTVVLFTTFILLGLLYFNPVPSLSERFKATHARPSQAVTSPQGMKLLDLEFNKAVEEIKFLLQLQDTWYHYKYLFIGAILAILLGQAGLLKYLDEASPNQNIISLREILTSGLIYLTVTFACVLCVMIDMHIRRHLFSVQALGLWIYYYAEPAYLGNIPDASGFLPWESFLRQDLSEGAKPFYLHIWEGFYRIARGTQLHFLSTAAYLLHAVLFQQMCLDFPRWRDGLIANKRQSEDNTAILAESRKLIIYLGFIFVHLSTLGLTLIIHSVGKQYEVQLFPFYYKSNGWEVFAYYLIYWILTVAVGIPYLIFLWRQPNKPQTLTGSISAQGST